MGVGCASAQRVWRKGIMASLNKLAIRGIRSFDDKRIEVIEFYSPLTVIVGHNGSGKTTIIECLKYATTGDLPPNTKGGAFVHDPKMANEKEVKAQVKLRFWNVNRQRMVATRNLQVTTKKTGALTMKTLEGLLAKPDDDASGKRNTISTKCSEMDEEVPLLLGVSRAILENVIFCHQEDSNWPLSEPAALKKKFDDIFEATKYTKALDNIKALRKERTAELKVDKERLKFLKADKDKAERMHKELEDMTRRERAKEAEVARLKEDFERLKEMNVQHYEQATGFQRIFERVDNLKKQREMLEKNRDRIFDGMTVMNESTEELQNLYMNFDAHLRAIEQKRDRQVEARKKEEDALEDLRRRERNLATTQGGLVANRKNYEKNVREREAAVREVAKAHNFGGYDVSPLEEAKVFEFIDKLHELVRRAESDLKKLQADGARRERDLQAELDRLASTKTTAIATKRSKQEQISHLNSRIRTAEANFESVSPVDADINVLEKDIEAAEGRRGSLETEIREARYDEQMRERSLAIRQKEADRDKANAELALLNRQADSRAQLAIKRAEAATKNGQVEASMQTHAQKFKELVGSDIAAENMEEAVSLAVGRRDRELQEAEAAAAASNRTVSQLQTSVNIAKQSLQTKREDLERLKTQIRDALADTEHTTIEDAISEAEKELEIRNDEIADSKGMINFYKKVLDVQTRMARLSASDQTEIQEEIADWIAVLNKLRKAEPAVATVDALKNRDIPALERQIQEDSAKLDRVQGEVEENNLAVQRAKTTTRDLQTLKSAATIVSRAINDVQDLRADIVRLERDLESTGTLKTVDEVQQEIEAISNDIKSLQREQQSLSADKELKVNTLRGLGDDIGRKTLRLGELRSKRDKRRMEEKALSDQRDTLVQLQNELKGLDIQAQTAEAPWKEKSEAMIRHRNERANAENEASLQVAMYQSSMLEIESKHKACQAYIADGFDRKIRENEKLMEDVRREIGLTTDAKAAVERQIASLQEEIARQNTARSNIKANLDHRDESTQIAAVQAELDEIDIEAAAKSRREFNTRYKENLDEETKVQNHWQLTSGVLQQMIVNREKAEKTLASDYKNIDKQFREQLIKTKTSEVANNDLEKYGKALDNAILKYHAIKMDEINDTIGHLWNKTYQGTDIDGIRIVSDHDEAGTTGTRKSYNYRVIMIKNDVELDMRGRCSAGQKVLASIIIRLALAESFGQGCGVLALDEPTTNLDQENINALAEALAEIIRERRRQANFQLIVITHDEGFLQRLAAHDVLEYYWRVSRDASQKSKLERQRVGI
ncbi:DNA repair protein rad50 [Cryptotrichosporon argae]